MTTDLLHALLLVLMFFAGMAVHYVPDWLKRRQPTRDVLTDQPMRGPYTDAGGTRWMLLCREVSTGHGSQPDTMRLDLVRQNEPAR